MSWDLHGTLFIDGALGKQIHPIDVSAASVSGCIDLFYAELRKALDESNLRESYHYTVEFDLIPSGALV